MTRSNVDALGERLRREVPVQDEVAHLAARHRLVEVATRRGTRGRSPWLGAPLGTALGAGAVALAVWLGGSASPSLELKVGAMQRPGSVGTYYASRTDAELPLRFSDGSEVHVTKNGAVRVTSLDALATTVQLEDGEADFRIVPRAGAAWRIVAGPYSVRVTGTKFRLAWDSTSRALELEMREGSVVVSGPGIEDGHVARGTERFVTRVAVDTRPEPEDETPASTPAATASVVPARTAPGPTEAPVPGSPSAAPAADPPAAVASVAPPLSVEPRRDWTVLVGRGAYSTVIAEATRDGLDQVLAREGAPNLRALADAARFGGRVELAETVLRAARERFPSTPAASSAAFVLGRLADDGGRAVEALRYYDLHLEEGGALAPEALGRKMLVLHRMGDAAQARRVADEYVLRFPSGPYARQARDLARP